MKRQTLLLVALSTLLLISCSRTESIVSSSELGSITSEEESSSSSSKSEKPEAPIDQIHLTLSNFCYTDVSPEPVITGLNVTNFRVSYVYLDVNTKDVIDDYQPGVIQAINAGNYILQADVKTLIYQPFTLTTLFTVTKADMSDISMVAYSYCYDEMIPEPSISGYPNGTEISLKYYANSSDKFPFAYDVENTLVPGSYSLEATFTNPNYDTVIKTYSFEVKNADFDEAYALNRSYINLGETDIDSPVSIKDADEYFKMMVVDTEEYLEGVTFTWKERPVLSLDGKAKSFVIAHKDYFNDKEYEIHMSYTPKEVKRPLLVFADTGAEPSTRIIYDGNEKTLQLLDFDETRVDILDGSTFSATDAGNYYVEVALKDPVNTKWSDGSCANIRWTWEIQQFTLWDAPFGFRYVLGDYVGDAYDSDFYLECDYVVEPVDLRLELGAENDTWVSFDEVEFSVRNTELGYAHFDYDNKLVITELCQKTIIGVYSENPNYYINTSLELKFYDDVALVFTPEDEHPLVNTYPTFIYRDGCGDAGEGYLLEARNNSYFQLGTTLNHVNYVKFKFMAESNMPSFNIKCTLSYTDYYEPSSGDMYKDITVESNYDGSYITLDLDFDWENNTDYYFVQFWISGDVDFTIYLTELIVHYTRV